MNIQFELIIIVVHVLLSFIYATLIISGFSRLRMEYIIPILLVPLFGPVVALVIDLLIVFGKGGTRSLDVGDLSFADDILWKTLKRFHEQGDLVPLEEAILINDKKTRRKYMLETLYEDPLKYLDVLLVARNNDDVETSHYATTSISYVQRSFQLTIQNSAIEIEKHPDDMELLDDYLNTLANYIASGLLEGHLLNNLRLVYSTVLDRKLAKVKNDKENLVDKLRNDIELGNYISAYEVSELLKKFYPDDEDTWIESIRVCVEVKDKGKLAETIIEMQNQKVLWTDAGREKIAPWIPVIGKV